jgi:hypothetical protein
MPPREFRKIEEIELLEGCASRDELRIRYAKRFGKAVSPEGAIAQHIRVGSLWQARTGLLKRLQEARKQSVMVMIPAKITHKGDQKKVSAFADDDIMVKIHNELALLVQLQREANQTHEKQYELFERRLEATVDEKVKKALKGFKCPQCEAESEKNLKQMAENVKANAAKGNVSAG